MATRSFRTGGNKMLFRRTAGACLPGWLRVAGFALAGCAVNLTFGVYGAAAKQCELTRLGSADLTIRDDGLLIVPVTVNDHPARMELETTSTASLIHSTYLQPFGLRSHHASTLTLDAVPVSQLATPISFTVGSQQFDNWGFWVLPDQSAPAAVGVPDVGRLGMDVLGAADFELDFAHNKLNFYSTEHCPGVVVYWTDNYSSVQLTRGPLGNYYFPVKLEGQRVEASISTSDANSLLRSDASRHLYGFDETSKDIQTQSDSAGHAAYYRAMNLTGSGIDIKNAHVGLDTRAVSSACTLVSSGPDAAAHYEGKECRGAEAPLLLGLNEVRHLHLYFATHERVLYFSDAAATK